ncbi:MAG: hypothetical protein IT215_07425 [Chitinophagaceae bacterium]|nr:MAG: hypothetical protein UZ11_BCD004001437 [Bacteroidetes bacterium OLB11]MCC6448499.1 hypothetical protein [Chitinophagaceae bacterium]HMN33771.1 hypothetical protein [Chitinophagaceae bacterium]
MYFDKAFDSRTFNTASQKARALRGIGYACIELQEYERAKEVYETSLIWEDSDIARNELKVISKKLEAQDIVIVRGSSNVYEEKRTYSSKYLAETINKLPNELKEKIPSKFIYIWSKASSLLIQGANEYRKNDYFNFPLIDWDENSIIQGVNQIVHFLKGFNENHFLEMDNIEDATNLLLTFHFETTNIKDIINDNQQNLKEITFKHKVDGDEIILFIKLSENAIKKIKWWKIW